MRRYKINDIIKVKVSSIEPYGVFVNVDSVYSGLIHISEITGGYIKNIDRYFHIGQIISCKVIEVDERKKQLKLSTKNNRKICKKIVKNILIETEQGFTVLEEKLPLWISEINQEIQKNKN